VYRQTIDFKQLVWSPLCCVRFTKQYAEITLYGKQRSGNGWHNADKRGDQVTLHSVDCLGQNSSIGSNVTTHNTWLAPIMPQMRNQCPTTGRNCTNT